MQNKLYKAAVDNRRQEVALATKSASAITGKARGRSSKKGLPPAIGGPGGEAVLVAKLGSQRVNNIFTHLRKVSHCS
jgi:hypothetical protein